MRPAGFVVLGFLLCSVGAHAQKNRKPDPFSAEQLEKGNQLDGKRVGKWNFYTPSGELELTFDYDSSRISFLRPDTSHYLVRVGEEWQPRRLHRAPRILGSSEFRLATITRSIRYPVTALQVGKQGTVLVGYTVGPDGHTTDYAIEGSLSKACDQEVARVLQLLPDTWIPAVYQGRPAATRHFLKVTFRIMSEAEHQRMIQARSGPAAKAQADDRPRYVQEVEVVAIGRTL